MNTQYDAYWNDQHTEHASWLKQQQANRAQYWDDQRAKHEEHRKWLKQQQAKRTNYYDLFTE